ncbi:MAG: cell division protein FtsA [Sulfurihydrogenibium sp.]|uniref:cell division protein FtsA n=1 Tax=Sulfurihydrogenibium sp. TaxID=2053621 RepID=UPI003D0DB4FF
MAKNKIFVSLDVGSSKIATIFADIDETGTMYVIGLGESQSKGIDKGNIISSADAIKSIKESISLGEAAAGFKVNGIFINIGGHHVESKKEKESITFSMPNKEIDQDDVNALIEKINSKYKNESTTILHIIPTKYILDDEDLVYDPIGLIGNKLTGEFTVITIKSSAYNNLKKVVESVGIRVLDLAVNPIASATSVLYPEEKELGVALIDIGGGLSDIAIYKNGSLEMLKSIPIGGHLITKDIAYRFKISRELAETIKIQYGLATVDYLDIDDHIDIPSREGDENIRIDRKELVETIEWRLREIFEILKKELEKSGFYDKLTSGIVLTGGVSNTPYIKELAEEIFEKDVRIGRPKDFKCFTEKLYSPQYATGVGVLQFLLNSLEKREITYNSKEKSSINFEDFINKFINKLKELF